MSPAANSIHSRLRVCRAIAALLRCGKQWDPEDAAKSIEEDWENDSRGEGMLTRAAFCDAIFELCDVWSPGYSEGQYAEFIRAMYTQCTDEMPSHLDPKIQARYIWKAGSGEQEDEVRAASLVLHHIIR